MKYIPYFAIGAACLIVGYITMDALQTLSYDVINIDGWGYDKP